MGVSNLESIIVGVLEKTLVGGAFLFLLYHYVTKVVVTLDRIAETMNRMDLRFSHVEKRLDKLEGDKHE